MRIDYLELINFKRFRELKAEFKPGVNVIVGVNGSGKTSILNGLAVALGGFFVSRLPNNQQRGIDPEEVFVNGQEVSTASKVVAKSDMVGEWSRSYNPQTRSNDSRQLEAIRAYSDTVFGAFADKENRSPAPIIAFYATERAHVDARTSRQVKELHDPNAWRRTGYFRPLDLASINTILEEWMVDEIVDLSTRRRATSDARNQTLDNIENALRALLTQFIPLSENEASEIIIAPSSRFKGELMLWLPGKAEIPLKAYSDGFRAIIYLVIDLIWRASQLNPWMDLTAITAEVSGVVLIDEIELHLHPRWQAQAIPFLQALLPNVQFFITTHSPTVLSNFNNGTLHKLTDGDLYEAEDKFFGRQVDDVLNEILGGTTRNSEVQEEINNLLRSITNPSIPIEQKEAVLHALYKLIGEHDEELQRAETLIDWEKQKLEEGE